MSEKGVKELSPIDIYAQLPKTNCKKCGLENCMAFATKLVNREMALEMCKPLLEEKQYAKAHEKLWNMLKPPVKEISIGAGENAIKIGGKLVMYRHELTFHNPTPIAIDVTDEMPEEELQVRSLVIRRYADQDSITQRPDPKEHSSGDHYNDKIFVSFSEEIGNGKGSDK